MKLALTVNINAPGLLPLGVPEAFRTDNFGEVRAAAQTGEWEPAELACWRYFHRPRPEAEVAYALEAVSGLLPDLPFCALMDEQGRYHKHRWAVPARPVELPDERELGTSTSPVCVVLSRRLGLSVIIPRAAYRLAEVLAWVSWLREEVTSPDRAWEWADPADLEALGGEKLGKAGLALRAAAPSSDISLACGLGNEMCHAWNTLPSCVSLEPRGPGPSPSERWARFWAFIPRGDLLPDRLTQCSVFDQIWYSPWPNEWPGADAPGRSQPQAEASAARYLAHLRRELHAAARADLKSRVMSTLRERWALT